MPNHREIKTRLEEFSARVAKIVYPNAIFDRQGNPNQKEPDFLFRDGERIIGVEVTTASYSENFLKDDFYIHSHPDELREKGWMPVSVADPSKPPESLDILLLKFIQARVDSKLEKTYSGCDELIICVYVHALLSSEDEVRAILEKVSLTKSTASVYAHCFTSDVATNGYLTKKLL